MVAILFFITQVIDFTSSIKSVKALFMWSILLCIFFLMLALIIKSIYNLFKGLFHIKNKHMKDTRYATWKYSKDIWRDFIINNYKINRAIELKVLFNQSIKAFMLINVIAIFIAIQNNESIYIRVGFLSFLYFAFIILYLIPELLRIFIFWIGNIIFTNYTVDLTNHSVAINNEIFISNIKGERAIIKKIIYNNNIEIYYSDEWSSSRYTAHMYIKKNNIKKLIIPIPKGEYKNAKKYVDEAYQF